MRGRSAWAVALVALACGDDATLVPTPDPDPDPDLPFVDVSVTHLPGARLAGRDMDAEPADLDADGDLDLVIAVEFGANLLLLNDGSGRFTVGSGRLPGPVHDSEDIAVADFDGDGDLDIVFVAEDDRTDEYYLNDGSGHFTDASDRLPPARVSNAVLAADLTGDGAPDLLVGNAGVNAFWENDGSGHFFDATADRYPAASRITQDLELGDIDSDGDLDLVEGNEDGNRVLINDGDGRFTDETEARFPGRSTEETREADLGDIDGDGDLDLVLGNVSFRGVTDATNRVLINDGQGVFVDESAARLLETVVNTVDVDLADIDGDGDLDLLEANFSGRGYRVLLNEAGAFTDRTSLFLPTRVRGVGVDVEVFDANGDGLPDVFLTHYQGRDHLVLGLPGG